jgi:hypothetical protein
MFACFIVRFAPCRSVQLALAKVECAALSVLEKCDSYVAMTDYLAVSDARRPLPLQVLTVTAVLFCIVCAL